MSDIDVRIEVRGDQSTVQAIEAIISSIETTTPEACLEVGQFVLDESNVRVPVLTGALQESGHVEISDEGSVTVKYGGGGVDYAVPVHERLDLRHTNGQAKFLESAVLDNIDGIAQVFRNSFEKNIDN